MVYISDDFSSPGGPAPLAAAPVQPMRQGSSHVMLRWFFIGLIAAGLSWAAVITVGISFINTQFL